MADRAAVVARAVAELFIATMCAEEFRKQLRELSRDEFADERRQAVADRSLDPDA
jgi:hypothetical protein